MARIPKIDCTIAEFNRKFDQIYDMLLNDNTMFIPKYAEYTDRVLYSDVTKKDSVTLKYFRGLSKHRQDVIATSNEMCAFGMTWMYFADRKKTQTPKKEAHPFGL